MENLKPASQDAQAITRSIMIGALLIAFAVVITPALYGGSTSTRENKAPDTSEMPTTEVRDDDYIRGAENPKVTIIEYSDLDCTFCERLHPNLERLIAEYPNDVAWVYRHFPLDSIHPNARQKAVVAECFGEAGGNDAFWTYIDAEFAGTPEPLALGASLGLDTTTLETCIRNLATADAVQEDFEEGQMLGVQGTPHNIAIFEDGEQIVINGAQPYEVFESLLDL